MRDGPPCIDHRRRGIADQSVDDSGLIGSLGAIHREHALDRLHRFITAAETEMGQRLRLDGQNPPVAGGRVSDREIECLPVELPGLLQPSLEEHGIGEDEMSVRIARLKPDGPAEVRLGALETMEEQL